MPAVATRPEPKTLADAVQRNLSDPTRGKPLWAGPCGAGPQGGVTQGLVAKYLVCPERFRVKTIEGLAPGDRFSKVLEYGNCWHVCEESFAAHGDARWPIALTEYAKGLLAKYPFSRDDVEKWFEICKLQFPIYVRYWAKHKDVLQRKPLLQEYELDVQHALPSGRVVRLRGKLDSLDAVGSGREAGLWIQENKSKGDIDEQQLRKQLLFDLQSMTYLVAFNDYRQGCNVDGLFAAPLKGIRYNVIRRPLSGGKGSIKQHEASRGAKCPKCKEARSVTIKGVTIKCPKCGGAGRVNAKPAETKAAYLARLGKYISDEPETYFMRWNVAVSAEDVRRFRERCLDPLLENIADDYEWWAFCKANGMNVFDGQKRAERFDHCKRHFVFPFGVYSPLTDGGATDADEFVMTGNTVGLQRVTNLFPELQNADPCQES